MRTLTKTLAVASLLASAHAFSLGIGEIKLHSSLNQNLHAEVGLTLAPGTDTDHIEVRMASPEQFDKAGVPWTYFLPKIKFQTIQSNGNVTIKLTSREALKEPFLNFLLEVNSPKGSFYREFTILVDPPTHYEPTVAPLEAQPTRYASSAQQDYPAPQMSPRTVRTGRPVIPLADLDSGKYGPTRPNDTLWKISERVSRQTGISIEQTMMGLYEANPRAFYKPNVNALLAGKTLVVPQREVFLRLSLQQARDLFQQQNTAWLNRTTVRPQPEMAVAVAEPQQVIGNQLKLVVPTPKEELDAGAVSATAESGDSKETEAMQPSQPETAGEAGELAADRLMAEKIATLERQLAEMQKLIALRNEELIALQRQAQPAVTADKKVPPAQAAVEKHIDPKPVPAAPKISKPTPIQIPAVKPDQGWGVEHYVLTGLGAGTLAYVGWIFWRRRVQNDWESSAEPLFVGVGGQQIATQAYENFPMPGLADNKQNREVSGDSENLFGGDFSVNDLDVFDIDQGEIDPVSEADVYMAYGRYQQAEELIRLAIKDQPERDDYHLKLLEIFFTSENKQAFEEYAQELMSLGKNVQAVFWDRVVEMGSEICPGAALFTTGYQTLANKQSVALGDKETLGQQASDNLFDDTDFDLASFDHLFGQAEQKASTADSQPSFDSKNFTASIFNKEGDFSEFDEPKPNNQPVEFYLADLPEIELESNQVNASDLNKTPVPDQAGGDAYLHEFPTFEANDQADRASNLSHGRAVAFKDSSAGPNFDDDFDFNTAIEQLPNRGDNPNAATKNLADLDEIELQLDLALAYVDMGDNQSARSIATQVLENGTQEQKMVAKSILENA